MERRERVRDAGGGEAEKEEEERPGRGMMVAGALVVLKTLSLAPTSLAVP